MGLIMWDAPKKLVSTQEHNEKYSSDCEVPGTFVPNMSREDRETWKGKLTTHKDGSKQIELRKSFNSVQMLIIVADDGYNYKHCKREADRWGRSTMGLNMHVSLNGGLQLTFDQWQEITEVVKEARELL